MRSCGWILIQNNGCPYKEGRFGPRHGHREKPGGDRGEIGVMPPQVQERLGLGRGSPQKLQRFSSWNGFSL